MHVSRASAACRHRVSGSLSLPSRGSFHLSLTVLYSIGHQVVFRLGGWSPLLPTGFLVSRSTPDTTELQSVSYTRLSLSMAGFPKTVLLPTASSSVVLNPGDKSPVWASSPFARHYLGIRCFFLFLRLLRCFSSPGSLRMTMDSSYGDRSSFCRVSPFGYLRINGYLLLPAAFRSLSRPSSAPGAKASALRPL